MRQFSRPWWRRRLKTKRGQRPSNRARCVSPWGRIVPTAEQQQASRRSPEHMAVASTSTKINFPASSTSRTTYRSRGSAPSTPQPVLLCPSAPDLCARTATKLPHGSLIGRYCTPPRLHCHRLSGEGLLKATDLARLKWLPRREPRYSR